MSFANVEQRRKYQREWARKRRKSNPAYRDQRNRACKDNYRRNRDERLVAVRARWHGLTRDQVRELRKATRCQLCGKPGGKGQEVFTSTTAMRPDESGE